MSLTALDVAIGLILVYFLLSLAVLAINETIATLVNFRAQTLVGGLETLVGGAVGRAGKDLIKTMYDHPLVEALHERRIIPFRKLKKPSYIPPRTFVVTLLGIIAKSAAAKAKADPTAPPILDPQNNVWDLGKAINFADIPDSLKTQLRAIAGDAQGDMAKVKLGLERWFDDAMERVSATYKSRIHTVGALIGLVVTFALNANTVTIARSLVADPILRQAVVAQAQEMVRNTPDEISRALARQSAAGTTPAGDTAAARAAQAAADTLLKRTLASVDTLRAHGLPLGFPPRPDSINTFSLKAGWYYDQIAGNLPGLLLTALAVSLGAPFWFDLMNKVVNVRGAGRAPEEKPKSPEASPPARGA